MTTPAYLAIGRVLRAHGVRGDMLLESLTDFPKHLSEVDTVYLGEALEPRKLDRARVHRHQLIIHLNGVENMEGVDPFRGQLVQIRAEAAAPLPEGAFYQHQVIGLQVVSDAGEALGELVDVLETGANDVYVVSAPGGELLLPAIDSVILKIDLPARRMTVHLLEGLR